MVNKKVMAGLFGIAAIMGIVCLAGCSSQAREHRLPMVVGIVNLDRVLPELPEYREYSDKYQEERLRLFKGLDPRDVKRFMTEAKRQEIEKSQQKWDDVKRRFLDQTMEKVRSSAIQVSHDKQPHIDVVLVNAPWYPVSERGAVDITTDVVIALKESGKTVH